MLMMGFIASVPVPELLTDNFNGLGVPRTELGFRIQNCSQNSH
jgi:hypothetical protein